ncbi:MAG: NAD(+) synthase [Mycoplasmataceae bacterium]|nr:NAD(+) synthase [Mycoplasmataceae bacterium]
MRNLKQYISYLQKWSKQIINGAHCSGVVVGLSGGVDSAVVANLLCDTTKVYGVWINIDSAKEDYECVQLLKKQKKFVVVDLDLTTTYKALVKTLKITNKLGLINLKVRMRMLSLYALAQEKKCLVAGTSNLDELYLGYFTKYGDGASDFAPLAKLNKNEVWELAKLLNVPQQIITRAPSAGLYAGQSDEKDMGVTYKEIDAYLSNKPINPKAKKIIDKLHKMNLHKSSLSIKPKK